MIVDLDLTTDVADFLRRSAAEAGQDVASFVRQVVIERLDPKINSPSNCKISHDEFMARIREAIALHPVSHGKMDDSRESIYAGCGE